MKRDRYICLAQVAERVQWLTLNPIVCCLQAHERTIHTDVLFGLLKGLLARRNYVVLIQGARESNHMGARVTIIVFTMQAHERTIHTDVLLNIGNSRVESG